MSHNDDFDDEGHSIDVKEYFKNLFRNRKTFWQELKLLVTPEEEDDVALVKKKLAALKNAQPSIPEKKNQEDLNVNAMVESEEEEEEEEDVEFEVVNQEIFAPGMGQVIENAEDMDKELKRVLYNKEIPLQKIKDFHEEVREVIVHPPRKKVIKESEDSVNTQVEESDKVLEVPNALPTSVSDEPNDHST
ncbi:MAG: hypothetical protein V4525_05880 [Pseudomonadota bacterium]